MYECTACGKRFGGERGFDRHRVGNFEVRDPRSRRILRHSTRRCLSADELLAAGYVQNDMGVWVRAYAATGDTSEPAGAQKGHS